MSLSNAQYQQTFVSSVQSAPEKTFRFQQIYNDSNRFKLRVSVSSASYYSDNDTSSEGSVYAYITNSSAFRGNVTDENGRMQNKYLLCQMLDQSITRGGSFSGQTPYILVDVLPYEDFTISLQLADGSIAENCTFGVTFSIELVEM